MQTDCHLTDFIPAGAANIGPTGFVRALPGDVQEKLLSRGQRRRFAKGQLIQQRGDPGTEFWYIESGSVQVGRFTADGKLILFALLDAGESFGEQAFLGEFPRMVDAIAGADCTLIRIGEAELQNLIETDAAAARILLKTMAHMVQQAFDLIEAGRNRPAIDRVAQALTGLCGEGEVSEIPITQQELADLVGLSRVSLGQMLAKLEIAGLVERRYGAIAVINRTALADYSGL